MRVLVVNAGSSTLKLRVLSADDHVETSVDVAAGDEDGLAAFVASARDVDAVGHRVVHGGDRYTAPAVVDDEVLDHLRALAPLAPLHQPAAVAGIEAVRRALPSAPAVACFDTAFHATMPAEATTYPLPRAWRERFGLRRYGFHGLSHSHAARTAAAALGAAARRVVTCHLGAGSSLAAVVDGRCVDTTMGFTPNEGLVMATRSGSVDPGMLLWLLHEGVRVEELAEGLQHRAGLLGLAGDADMRRLLAAADQGDDPSRLAIDVWLHRLCAGVAAMAAAAGGIDALVFTGGIGQHSPVLRDAAVERLRWLGVGSVVPVLVVEAREDLEIARGARAALAPRGSEVGDQPGGT